MATPQPGLFAQGLTQHYHVEFALKTGAATNDIRHAIATARREATWLPGPNVTWGFSPKLWAMLSPGTLPPTVQPFEEIRGMDDLVAPSTQWDIWAWCSGAAAESCAGTAASIVAALSAVADLELKLPAYTAADARDPSGFIDGTENPLLDEAYEVAIFPEGSVGEGGSAVTLQKWIHRLAAFQALPVAEQEGVIGRTREASIELPEALLPQTSHVSRNTVLDSAGRERHIYRRNTQFVSGTEVGTQFIGATNDPSLMTEMLERMFGATSDRLIDRLATFSTAVTGSVYFVPSMQALTSAFGPLKGGPARQLSLAEQGSLPTAGNLRIGSLK